MDMALHRTLKGFAALALLSLPTLAFAFKPDCLPVKILPNGSLATATVGQTYNEVLAATEGVTTIANPSYSVSLGTLPANITLSAGGVFGGSPTASGNTPVRITVVNLDTGCSGSREYVLHVDPSAGTAPSFTPGGNQTVNEDAGAQSVAWATGISDNDGNTQTLNFTVDANTNTALFSVQPAVSAAGTLTYTPAADANGSADITVTLHDSGASNNVSTPATFTINVTAVNDAPSFTKGADQQAFESSGAHSVNPWATAMSAGPADESGQALNFIVTNNNNPLFSVQPAVAVDGTLSYTLQAGQSGTAIVSVSLHDDGGTANSGVDTSAVQTFNIVVDPINHAPTFTSGGNVTVNEDSGAYSNAWATAVSDADGNTQALDFIVSNDNNGLFTVQPSISAAGVLSFTPVANASGSAQVTVQLHDNGGTANGGSDTSTPAVTFTLAVSPVDDAPVNTVPADLSVGTAFSNTALAISGLSVADIDAASGTMTTTLSAVSGGITVSLAGGASVSGGSNGSSPVTLSGTLAQLNAALATLSYKSNDGFTGTDTLTVLTNDGGNTGSGGPLTDTDTFHVGVVPQVFIIDNTDTTSDALSTAGTAANPYNSIASFNTNAADGAGDYIYVNKGTGTYSEAAGFTLFNNEQLYGQGQTLQFTNPVTGAIVTVGSGSAANTPTISITGASQFGVMLAQGNTLRGFDIATTLGNEIGIVDGGGTVGSLTVNDVNVSGTGMAVDIDQGGSLNVTIDSLSSTGSTQQGVQLAGTSLSGSFNAPAGAISGSTGTGFLVGDGSGTANTGGTATISYGGTISTTGTARALDIEDRSAGAGTVTFSGNISHSSGNAIGIFIDDIAAGAITLSGANSLNTGTANAIQATDITGGSLTLSGNQDIDTTGGKGISLGTNSVATSFSGAQITVNTTSGNGIDIASNSGAVSFANAGNGLDVVTTAGGAGIFATASGTLTITGTGNTISSVSAPALSVSGTTIGASGLNFLSIGTNGGANGIVLNNTGTSGALTVYGDGSNNASGGTIQNTTAEGVLLTNTFSPSFTSMKIQTTAKSGISGTQVTNFSFINGTIDASGTSGSDSNIAFNTPNNGKNITGTLTVTGSTLTNAYYSGLDVQAGDGIVTNANVSNNTVTSSTSAASSFGYGINFVGIGSASTVFALNNATINGNTVTNFPSAGGVQVNISQGSGTGPGATAGIPNDASNLIAITNNAIHGQSAVNRMNTSAVLVTVSSSSTNRSRSNFSVTGNGTLAVPMGNTTGTTIGIGANGNTTMTGVVNNNVIVSNQPANSTASNGISGGNGVAGAGNAWTPDLTLTVNGNNISATDGNGILLVGRGASGTAKFKIQSNTVAAPLGGVRPGIRVDAGNTGSADDSVCLNISSNTSAGSGGSQGIGLRKQGTVTTTNDFSVNGMAATATPGVESYVNGLNPAGGSTLLISATSGFSNCSLP